MKSGRSIVFSIVLGASVLSACGGNATDEASTTSTIAATPSSSPATTLVPVTTAPSEPTVTTAPPTTTTTTEPPATTAPSTTATTQSTMASGAGRGVLDAAIATSAAVTSYRMEGVIAVIGIEGQPFGDSLEMTFSGAFDAEAGAFSFAMDLSALAAAMPEDELPPGFEDMFTEMEMRQIGDTAYLRFPFFTTLLGIETDWISFPADQADATQEFTPIAPVNPTEFLATFESVGAEVTEVGPETIRGTATTHYRVVFDVEQLLEQADPEELAELQGMGPLPAAEFPLDAWISDDGLIHRFVVTWDGDQIDAPPGEGFERMEMRFDMFDYGTSIEIAPPPDDQVTDGSDIMGLLSA